MTAILLALAGIFCLVLDLAVVAPTAGRDRRRGEWLLPVCGCACVLAGLVMAFTYGDGLVLA